MSADSLFDADLAHTDTFWADMRAKTSVLLADLLTLEADMDELSLELTRCAMRQDGLLGYITLDCRDGVHGGCETCDCTCHRS